MNAAKETASFIEERPMVKECIAKGLINYSKLSRAIIQQQKLKNSDFDAVLIAVRRFASTKARHNFDSEKAIQRIFKERKLEIKTNICTIVLDESAAFSQIVTIVEEINEKQEHCHLISGSRTFTLITAEEFLEKILRVFAGKIVSKKKNLVQIVLRTSKEIESTPGVVAFIFGLFAERGINIVETMSSWTETLIVIEEKDLQKAMQTLK
jgi:aspartokinase